ncbi:MAG: SpoIIE family protein phosphatase [bacterium]
MTRVECWIYLIAVYILLKYFSGLNPFQSSEIHGLNASIVWYGLPRFIYLSFKIYLIALLVKIPVVLIYNFARLSRKLKIAGLFQSTFPQFIQLIMLLLIFYFLVAGLQADKMRNTVLEQCEKIAYGEVERSLDLFILPANQSSTVLQIKGYEPVQLTENIPDMGIVEIKQPREDLNEEKEAFLLFFKSPEIEEELVYFVKLDSHFLRTVSENTSILAGSYLFAYPYHPSQWESYFYKLSNRIAKHHFRIFPFGLTPHTAYSSLAVPFGESEVSQAEWVTKINRILAGNNRFTIGRVISPLMDAKFQPQGYFAFDILAIPNIAFFSTALISYFLLLLGIYALVNLLVTRRMIKFGSEINQIIVHKVNQLKVGIREISTGNLDYKVKLEGNDEFVEFAERFNQMGDKLKDSIAEAREKERLAHELTIARQVQLDLLPRNLPEIRGFQIAATLETANEVGGDFYDILPLSEDKYLFTIGDVSGKGTSAAFYMAQCISLIRYSPQFTENPREVVLRLNQYFSSSRVDRQVFVTAIVGVLDTRAKTVKFVRAGHTLPVHLPGRKRGEIREIGFNGLGIGLERIGDLFEKNLEEGTILLGEGDSIIFYTDGVIEAARTNPSEEGMQFFGEDRFRESLQALRGKSADEILVSLTEEIESFYQGEARVDDYTLLIIQMTKV